MVVNTRSADRFEHRIACFQYARGKAPSGTQQQQVRRCRLGSVVAQQLTRLPVAQARACWAGARSPQHGRGPRFDLDFGARCFDIIHHPQPLQGLPALRVELPSDAIAPVAEQLPGQLLLILERGDDETTWQVEGSGKPCQVMQIQIGDR